VLASLADGLVAEVAAKLDRAGGDPFAAAEQTAADALKGGGRSPVMRLLKFRTSESDLGTVLTIAAELMLGHKPIWHLEESGAQLGEVAPAELMSHATGESRAATDQTPLGQPLLSEVRPASETFAPLQRAGVLPLSGLRDLLDQLTDAELEQARQDTRTLIEDGAVIAQTLESVFGRDAFGVGMLRAVAPELRKPPIRAFGVIMLAALRRGWTKEKNDRFDVILQAIRDAAPHARKYLKSGTTVKRKSPPRPQPRPGGATHGRKGSACPPSVASP
jgi:hypothetical protein